MIILDELIGKRILGKASKYGANNQEFFVLELSPSKIYVKLQNQHGQKFWLNAQQEFVFTELLLNIEPRPKHKLEIQCVCNLCKTHREELNGKV